MLLTLKKKWLLQANDNLIGALCGIASCYAVTGAITIALYLQVRLPDLRGRRWISVSHTKVFFLKDVPLAHFYFVFLACCLGLIWINVHVNL
jgi:hypothetical protein